MATTFVEYTGDGNATKAFTFPSLQESDVKVRVDGVLKTTSTHYNITSYTITGGGNVVFTAGNIPSSPANIRIYRDTNVDTAKATYTAGSSVKADDLNNNNTQLLYRAQEEQIPNLIHSYDIDDDAVTMDKLAGGALPTDVTVASANIVDGTIVNADINASAAIAGSKVSPDFGSQNIVTTGTLGAGATTIGALGVTGNITVSGTVDGRDVATDGSKLDGIEAGATADQTNAEIRTAVEAATDSNVFTDADHTKLNGIETGATADQSASEIRALVESASDSNVFTDADHSKLNGIEASATADQTAAEIRTLVESATDSNVFTDADHTKLNAIEASADVTDATNVDAAGAVMNSDLATKGQILVGDGSGDPTALPVGTNNYVLVADSNEPTGVKWSTAPSTGGLNNTVEDTTPQLGGNLDVQTNEINTSTTNGNIKLNPNGTGVVEIKGDGSSADGTLQLNCSQNSHGVKIKSPAHSAGASYTLTLPTDTGSNGQALVTNGSGVLSFSDTGARNGNTIFENLNEITTNYTISANSNAFSMGPMTITNATVTVGSGETYTILG